DRRDTEEFELHAQHFLDLSGAGPMHDDGLLPVRGDQPEPDRRRQCEYERHRGRQPPPHRVTSVVGGPMTCESSTSASSGTTSATRTPAPWVNRKPCE